MSNPGGRGLRGALRVSALDERIARLRAEGLSRAEIARRTGRTVEQVSRALQRAREAREDERNTRALTAGKG